MLTEEEYAVLKKYAYLAEEPSGLDRPAPPGETMQKLIDKDYMAPIVCPAQYEDLDMVRGHRVTDEGLKAIERYENRQ